MSTVKVFVAEHGNGFMADIADWIVEAATQSGRHAVIERRELPRHDPGVINLVVAPHEFFVLHEADDLAIARAAAASVPICTEQPGTPWFNLATSIVRDAPMLIDINAHGVAALEARGLDAVHLRLGGVPSMRAQAVDRDIDLLFLGGSTPRRARELAALAPFLWDRNAELRMFRFSRPVDAGSAGVVLGQRKYELLARSRMLLNIHRDGETPGYFEWARMIEAMANGCVVVSEPSTGHAPLVAGDHFVAIDDIADAVRGLLDDPTERTRIGEAARVAVLDDFPLVSSLAPILDSLEDITPSVPSRLRPVRRTHRPPLFAELRPADDLRRRVFEALVAEQRFQREVDRARCIVRHGSADVVERSSTPAFDSAEPEVSVIVTLYDYADVVGETLRSIVESRDVALEIVIVDDHSRDDGRARVVDFMAEWPDVAILLVGSEVNRGLTSSRNLAIEHVRADKIMVVDADNLLYPTCLRRLADALDADPAAAFAYSTLEAFGADPGLRSELAWSPRWLCEGNYIDAQAMVRRSTFERHGGYRDPSEAAYGWEDWELWLRLAAAGERGVHVAQMLGRYRTQISSMVTITNLAADETRASLVETYPSLPWPEHDDRVDERSDADIGVVQDETERLEAELAGLNERLGRARRAQEHLQHPSTVLTEAVPERLDGWRRRLSTMVRP